MIHHFYKYSFSASWIRVNIHMYDYQHTLVYSCILFIIKLHVVHYRIQLISFQSAMMGGRINFSDSAFPSTLTTIPTPAGIQPSPNAFSSAIFTANPEQCIGKTYIGAGRSFSDRNSTVGAMRGSKSAEPR